MLDLFCKLYSIWQNTVHETALKLLQTWPGIDLIGAAVLLVEIGGDMSVFGSAGDWHPGWEFVWPTTGF